MSTSCMFPTELVLNILYYSDPCDIIRWRTVSKWFRSITHDELLWEALYINSSLPRPPGPSTYQSSAYLEGMLFKSMRLAESWVHGPMREVSGATIELGRPLAATPTKLIAGRWLVGCEKAKRFVLHDADHRAGIHGHQILWEQKEPTVNAWDVHSVSPVAGRSIVYILLELSEIVLGSPKWRLLEFQLHDESGEVHSANTIDPPAWAWSSLTKVELHGGKSRFLFISAKTLRGIVFDTQTRKFYAVPDYCTTLGENHPLLNFRMEFTDTYIICFNYVGDSHYEILTLIQTFIIPPDDPPIRENVPRLSPTHEGISDEHLYNVVVTKARVDPITGVTSLKLLDYHCRHKELKILVVQLTLPKISGSRVSKMKVDDSRSICIPQKGIKTSLYSQYSLYLDVCGDKQIRGFFRGKLKERSWKPVNQDIMKFAVDLNEDSWATESGEVSSAEWKEAADAKDDETGRNIAFDGLRGTLCYVHPKVRDRVVVVEMK